MGQLHRTARITILCLLSITLTWTLLGSIIPVSRSLTGTFAHPSRVLAQSDSPLAPPVVDIAPMLPESPLAPPEPVPPVETVPTEPPPTATPTAAPTATATHTPLPTATPTDTPVPTFTATPFPTEIPTATWTSVPPTATPVNTHIAMPAVTFTPLPTATSIPGATVAPEGSPTANATLTPTVALSPTLSVPVSPLPTASPTPTAPFTPVNMVPVALESAPSLLPTVTPTSVPPTPDDTAATGAVDSSTGALTAQIITPPQFALALTGHSLAAESPMVIEIADSRPFKTGGELHLGLPPIVDGRGGHDLSGATMILTYVQLDCGALACGVEIAPSLGQIIPQSPHAQTTLPLITLPDNPAWDTLHLTVRLQLWLPPDTYRGQYTIAPQVVWHPAPIGESDR